MAIPTFNSSGLFSDGERDMPGPIEPRFYAEHMPGAHGQYIQPHGKSGREIVAAGWLAATSAVSATVAMAALKTLVRAKQALADGTTIATYVGTDGSSYAYCVMLSYAAGPAVITGGVGAYTARCRASARLRQLNP